MQLRPWLCRAGDLLIIAALVGGPPDVQDFALYLVMVMTLIPYIGWLMPHHGELVSSLERRISYAVSVFYVAALVMSGHPLIAVLLLVGFGGCYVKQHAQAEKEHAKH